MYRSWRLDRYVMRELWTPTVLGLVLYTFVLLMNHFFVVAEKSLSKNLGFDLTLRLFLTGIPQLLVLSIPMAWLLGTLIGMGRLSSDSEWIAIQGAGEGPRSVMRPVVLHGLLGTILGFFIYAVVVPQANFALRNLRGEILFASHLASDLQPRVFYELPAAAGSPVLYVEDIRPGNSKRLVGVLLTQRGARGERYAEVFRAEYGDLYPAPDRSGALVLDLHDGVWHQFDEDDPEHGYVAAEFQFIQQRLDSKSFMQALMKPPNKVVQDYSLRELWGEFAEARQARDQVAAAAPGQVSRTRLLVAERRVSYVTVELHQRVALPVASLLFALLGMPLGIVQVRSGKGAGFAISLLAILIYYATFKPMRNAALQGSVPAALGPWVADLIILAWALFAHWRLRKRTGRRGVIAGAYNALFARMRRLAGRTRPSRPDATADLDAADELATLGGTSTRFLARLDGYIVKAFLRVVAMAMLAGYMVYALVEIQSLADDLMNSGQSSLLLLQYLQFFAPSILSIVLPVSCLVGGVVAFTILARSGELVAIKASGMGMRRATVPVLLMTLVFCAMQFVIADRIAPGFGRKAQELRDRIRGRVARTHGTPAGGRWSFGPDKERLYHYQVFDPGGSTFGKLHIYDLDRDSPRILAHRATDQATWTGETWEISGGWYRTFPAEGQGVALFRDNTDAASTLTLASPENFAARDINITAIGYDAPEQMSIAELREQLRTLQASGYDTTKMWVAYHGKFASALAPLVMVLLGLPFAFKVGRKGSLYGVGVALLLVIVYWAAFAVFTALGEESIMPAAVAAWMPNALFGLLGTYLLLYIRT